MKTSLKNYILFLLFLTFPFVSYTQEKAIIGMSIDEVKKIYPTVKAAISDNETTLSRAVNLYGLDDFWGYRFKENKLTWIFFHKYMNDINEANFNKCLTATRYLIKDFTGYYGKPDKQPVAIYIKMKPFTNQVLQLNKGDCIYLTSDGYKDQFGGPENKKFKAKQLKQLLIDNCQLTMEEQKEVLDTAFEKWRGEHEQIDDITILGIKI